MATLKKETYPEDWVSVFVAPGTGKDKGTIFVGVNGKGYYVPRGKSVMVPPEVAEVLKNREAMLEIAEEYESSVTGSKSLNQSPE